MMKTVSPRTIPVAILIAFALAVSGPARAEQAPRSERAPLVSLELYPESLELTAARDARRILVTGVASDGLRYDLSAEAVLAPVGGQVAVDLDGYLVPQEVGETEVVVSAAGLEARLPVRVTDVSPQPVSFLREVVPAISKVGCNTGTCHGSQEGQAGFMLSLRGYDPLFDYRALVDDISGRRFNRSKPSQSLMLLKPTQGVPHEGGFLFDESHRYYKLIEQWIAEGCRYDSPSRAARLEVVPEKPLLQSEKDGQQLIVIAHFPDGTTRDVTRDAVYETSDFEIATVSRDGRIQAVRRGEAAALVRYEGLYAVASATILGDREGFAWVETPEYSFVDAHVNEKLRRMKILPSELCSDGEFLRRVSFDLTGVPPTAEEVRAFLDDPRDSRTKREAMIDELLDSPGYVDHWTLKWSDLLLSSRKYIKEKGAWAFRNWIRASVAVNKPYDEFVRELITAGGSSFENPASNYFRIGREPEDITENMTQVFIGTRFNCNKCHDHPFERWTQRQYYELAAFFADVGIKAGALPDDEIVYPLRDPRPIKHPTTGETIPAKFPFDHAGHVSDEAGRREQLAQWLTAPENPYFARSLVNRYWSYFTGVGIIEPVDDIRAGNPPTNPELLDALTEDFVASGFDLKRLIRTIVTSHTYQRSHVTNEWNEDDRTNFSHAVPRRLSAEQLFDAIIVATGAPADLPGVPPGFRATQLPDPTVEVTFLDMFGRAPRESPCECERSSEVSLRQTLNLINGPTIGNAIIHPEGLVARLIAAGADEDRLIEEVYLATFCRLPTEEERADAAAYFTEVGDPAEAAQDLMWALINSPAFLFNR